MPIYFLLSIWVLLSVGREPTPQAYAERGALFYNSLTRHDCVRGWCEACRAAASGGSQTHGLLGRSRHDVNRAASSIAVALRRAIVEALAGSDHSSHHTADRRRGRACRQRPA